MEKRVALAIAVAFMGRASGFARCNPTRDPDQTDIVTVRATVEGTCGCLAATSHGAYVHCVAHAAKGLLHNRKCLGAVVRCAARSTCGRTGFVTCCRTSASGKTSCSIKHGHCKAPKHGSACVGTASSCCDACGGGGCASPSTTTLTVTTTTSTTSLTTDTTPCGSFVTAWGSEGTANGQFQNPQFVATDLVGHVYVTDFYNHRVQKFDESGGFITAWGSPGSMDGQFDGAS